LAGSRSCAPLVVLDGAGLGLLLNDTDYLELASVALVPAGEKCGEVSVGILRHSLWESPAGRGRFSMGTVQRDDYGVSA
jgi:hypothetical protein